MHILIHTPYGLFHNTPPYDLAPDISVVLLAQSSPMWFLCFYVTGAALGAETTLFQQRRNLALVTWISIGCMQD